VDSEKARGEPETKKQQAMNMQLARRPQKVQKRKRTTVMALPVKRARLDSRYGVAPNPGPELKNTDNSWTFTLTSTGVWSTISFLTPLAQSLTASSARIGRSVNLKSLLLRWSFTAPREGRIAVIYDREPEGALPGITEIFNNSAIGSINDLMNLDNSDRFEVICDVYINQSQGLNSGSPSGKVFRKLNHKQKWQSLGTTGVIANCQTGTLLMMVCQNNGTATPDGTFNIESRVRYTDA